MTLTLIGAVTVSLVLAFGLYFLLTNVTFKGEDKDE